MFCGATWALVGSFPPSYTPGRRAEGVYRRVSIQLVPLGTALVCGGPTAASRAKHGTTGAVWAATIGLAIAAALLLVQSWQSRSLAEELARERARSEAIRHVLNEEVLSADQQRAALEQDLRAIEGEAERLYDVVRAMRGLGEQLRERVGLPGPVLEPLPELPSRSPSPLRPDLAGQLTLA